ncbi:MAG: cupin domain-containing protein [Rhodobacteraceae bacterium]|jgi:uncharacterized cupin superfamily protein|nr:cupin domain-containing protein [Paracoccaceae bacterium]
MIVHPAHAPLIRREDGITTLHLSEAGGLRQFGCYVETLPPGTRSSERHWHLAEDEALYLLSGTATVVDDCGAHVLTPGDAAIWRRGEPDAHHVQNRSAAPATYVIVGSRVAGDICHYPDSGTRMVNHATTWEVLDAAGTRLRGGDLPPELLDLAPDWGGPRDTDLTPRRIQPAATREWLLEDGYIHPILGPLGAYRHCVLGDPGGLTQFGLHLEDLPPGGTSSFRHWHEREDEMILVLSGAPTLIEDTETLLAPGDAACWPAGQPIGHRLENRSDRPATYLTLGTRFPRDVIHYTDHDLITHNDGPARRYLRRDGTEYPPKDPHGGAT